MSFEFPALQPTKFESAMIAVRSYRLGRAEDVEGTLSIPPELVGISHIIAVEYDDRSGPKIYTVIRATRRGLSVIDTSLVRGIRPGGAANIEPLRRLIGTPRADQYAAAVDHIRSEIGDLNAVIPLRDHFYRVEGARAAELCYALFNESEEISGLAFGPTVGRAERAYCDKAVIGIPPMNLPVQVIWGGRLAIDNHHFALREQRYALDLEAPLGCSSQVVAMCEGTVVSVQDGCPDSGAPQFDSVTSRLGNHVVVRAGDFEIVYAHLQCASICVAIGARIRAGEILGVVGNSGFSTRPHLHVHARTIQQRQGIPLVLRIDGELLEPKRGDRLSLPPVPVLIGA